MPSWRPTNVDQDPDAVFQCPCGFLGEWNSVIGHRHGWRKRPECAGKIVSLGNRARLGGVSRQSAPDELDQPVMTSTVAEQAGPEPASRPVAYEVIDALPDNLTDPEEIARLLNLRRRAARGETEGSEAEAPWWDSLSEPPAPPSPPGDDGADDDGGYDGDGLPPGAWETRPGGGGLSVSVKGENVVLPAQARGWYDWFVRNGWSAGGGTFSDWVWDVLLCHFRTCMGKAMVVVDREEVELVAS